MVDRYRHGYCTGFIVTGPSVRNKMLLLSGEKKTGSDHLHLEECKFNTPMNDHIRASPDNCSCELRRHWHIRATSTSERHHWENATGEPEENSQGGSFRRGSEMCYEHGTGYETRLSNKCRAESTWRVCSRCRQAFSNPWKVIGVKSRKNAALITKYPYKSPQAFHDFDQVTQQWSFLDNVKVLTQLLHRVCPNNHRISFIATPLGMVKCPP